MLRLPARLEAHLVDSQGRRSRVPDILIGVNLLADGRYYYGNLLGLTNADGVVTLDRHEIELRFISDRVDAPMDYKRDLEDCDPLVEFVVLSAQEVAAGLAATKGKPRISRWILELWSRARNETVAPALARVWADLPGKPLLSVVLQTAEID